MKYKLYGDGIHDDYYAIQEMLDSGACEVRLPTPQKNYLISKTLIISSNTRLLLPRFAEIRLADGANCHMVRNKMEPDYAERLQEDLPPHCKHLWYYVNEFSPDALTENIEISGGVWNFNNLNQLPNPEQTEGFGPYGYTGEGMLFYGVKNMKFSDMTLKDPVHWGASFDRVSYFTVENIVFDYNLGNPFALNMDGVHFNGNCHFGVIKNLKGACYDDMVALNAHEGSKGPITNISIDGLFAENCHSAVRLLTVGDNIENIHISNVYGTYYQYCIGLTKYYPGETSGVFDGIFIDNVYASKAKRDGIYPFPDSYVFPLIYIQENTRSKNISISNLYRKENNIAVETVYIGKNSSVHKMLLENITAQNRTGKPMPMIVANGEITDFTAINLSADGDAVLLENGVPKEI